MQALGVERVYGLKLVAQIGQYVDDVGRRVDEVHALVAAVLEQLVDELEQLVEVLLLDAKLATTATSACRTHCRTVVDSVVVAVVR